MSISVFWSDEHELGVKGVIEVASYELPRQDARVSDLVRILNLESRVPVTNDGVLREVSSIWLYGRRLSPSRLLEAILANTAGSSPRLVAKMRTRPTSVTYLILRVESLTGKSIPVPCSWQETVSCFKLRVRDIEGVSPEEQILVHNDTKLEDHRTLASYSFVDGNTISLLLKLSGGFTPSRVFADVSNDSILVTVDFKKKKGVKPNAPRWFTASKGLNIEGKCETQSCDAFGQMIIHPKRFEQFNLLLDHSVKCPMCRNYVKPVICGFYDCAWRFDGMKAGDNYTISSQWMDASGHKYHRFDTNQKNSCVNWESLLIVAKPREVASAAKLGTNSDNAGVTSSDICSICWSRIGSVSPGTVVATTCKHTFHRKCFCKWSTWCSNRKALQSCPTCRKPLRLSTPLL